MERAKVLKEKKIASLRKQIEKISALDFEDTPDKTTATETRKGDLA